jgi:hypothetical protein
MLPAPSGAGSLRHLALFVCMRFPHLLLAAGLVLLAHQQAGAQHRPQALLSATASSQESTAEAPRTLLDGTHFRSEVQRSGSVVPVVVLSAAGALAGGWLFSDWNVGRVDEDCNPYVIPLAFTAGSLTGGLAGAVLGSRRAAPLQTALGTAVGSIPLLLVASGAVNPNLHPAAVALPAFSLPVVGTWIGNRLGQ